MGTGSDTHMLCIKTDFAHDSDPAHLYKTVAPVLNGMVRKARLTYDGRILQLSHNIAFYGEVAAISVVVIYTADEPIEST